MKFTFDLFHGDESPSKNFVGWVPKWWYRSVGLPIEKGVLPSGDEWLSMGGIRDAEIFHYNRLYNVGKSLC